MEAFQPSQFQTLLYRRAVQAVPSTAVCWGHDVGSGGEVAVGISFFHPRKSTESQSEVSPQFPSMFSVLVKRAEFITWRMSLSNSEH